MAKTMPGKPDLATEDYEISKFVFRLPRNIHMQLKEAASKDGRSMNSYLMQILMDHFFEDRTILDKLDKMERMIQRKLDKK